MRSKLASPPVAACGNIHAKDSLSNWPPAVGVGVSLYVRHRCIGSNFTSSLLFRLASRVGEETQFLLGRRMSSVHRPSNQASRRQSV